ncbi:phage terminase large subunit family protein [Methylobacterium nodulans]|uniref:Terminase GpA n=1 Tax=Methylobacterium nodulans (strain LMG 21967 / CNCM I-2342 / ORS 2060) TaxID=460265 RepID=B8IDR3_METNO|nr:terminase gpA endonuclease subunit [Methylobacterium nodulans]ACL55635.1 terminase GpA [Methylobacterium nodulans ORS 2060]
MTTSILAEEPRHATGRSILFAALAEACEPVEELTVSEWADRYRIVAAESGSPFPGPWRTDRMPHLREPMDCLHPDHPAATITLKCSAQVGKSEIIVNWFGYIVDRAPGPMMTMLPSLDEAVKFNRVKLQPTIDASPRIRHRVRPENSRDEAASTTSFKRFSGGFNQIVTASSSKGLQMVSIRYMARDEISEYPFDTDGRGDPVEQSRARLKTFSGLGLAKELNCSTPGLAGFCRISDLFEAGDRRRRYVPCPHCGDFQVLTPANLQAPSEATGWRATFACQSCGQLIDQVDRAEMLARAEWIPTWVPAGARPVPEVIPAAELAQWLCPPCTGRVRERQPSYAIWAAYSPLESWTDIWRRGDKAAASPILLKSHVQQDLGEAYEAKSDAPAWEALFAAREAFAPRVVPYPAAVLTAFIDVQGNRLEWGVWAWGPRLEGWLIDRGVIPYPSEVDEAWVAVDELLARTYPTQGGAEIPIDVVGIDTGFHGPDLYLRIRGRSHRLKACKGANKSDAIPITATVVKIRDKFGRDIGAVELHHIGNFGLKGRIYQGLANLVAGRDASGRWRPETLHLCADLVDEAQCKQLTAEILVDPREEAKGKARRSLHQRSGDQRVWMKKAGQANEALDIVVGARALAFGLGVDSYTPERWAQLWRERAILLPEPDLFTDQAATHAQPEAPAGPATARATPRLFGLAKPSTADPSSPPPAKRGIAALAALNRR